MFPNTRLLFQSILSRPKALRLILPTFSCKNIIFQEHSSQKFITQQAPRHSTLVPKHSINSQYLFKLHYCFASSKAVPVLSKEDALIQIRSLYESGMASHEQKKLEEALKYYSQALSLANKAKIVNTLDLGFIKNNMGDAYLKQGDLEKASKCIEKASKIFSMFPNNNEIEPHIVRNTYTKAIIYNKQGLLEQAYELFIQVLKRSQALPPEGRVVPLIVTYDGLGGIYQRKGEIALAIEYWKQGLDVFLEYFGDEALEVINLYEKLAWAHQDLGKLDEALVYAEKCLACKVKHYGENSLEIGPSLYLIGHLYSNKADYTKALEAYNRVLKLLEDHSVQYADQIGATYMLIGKICFHQNDAEQAHDYFKRAVQVFRQTFGENSLKEAECYTVWADLFKFSVATLQDAEKLYGRALNIYKKLDKMDEPVVIRLYYCLGEVLFYEEKFDEALGMFKECLRLSLETVYKPKPLEDIYSFLGAIYYKQEDNQESMNYYEKAVQSCETLDNVTMNLEFHYRNLGAIYEKVELLEKARDSYARALDLALKKYGASNQVIQKVTELLVGVQRKLEKAENSQGVQNLFRANISGK